MHSLLRNMIDNIMINDEVRGISRRDAKGGRGRKNEASIYDDEDAGYDTQLAYAVLLVDLAMIDQRVDQREYQVIAQSLIRLLKIHPKEVAVLVERAKKELAAFRGSTGFGEQLGQVLSIEERQALLKAIEEIIIADGVVDGFEVYLHQRFAKLLNVSDAAPMRLTGEEE